MGYLYDWFMNNGMTYRLPETGEGETPERIAADATVVHVDSAIEYWEFGTPPEGYIGVDDMPNPRPFVDHIWIETRLSWLGLDPESIRRTSAASGIDNDSLWRSGAWHWGLLCERLDLTSYSMTDELRTTLEVQVGDKLEAGEVRWVLNIYLFAMSPLDLVPMGPLIWWTLPLGENCSVLEHVSEGRPAMASYPIVPDQDREFALKRAYADSATIYLPKTFFAVSAINSPRSRLIPDPTRQRTYDLDISGLRQVLDDFGKAPDFGLRHALHACRSYFNVAA